MSGTKSLVCTVRATFRAPVPYVFRWCTDYTPGDGPLEGEKFQRKILARSRTHVVYEDLELTTGGWFWSRWNVSIHPPDRWRADATGNYRDWTVDYRLRSLPGDRTELTLQGRRTPSMLGTRNPSKVEVEKNLRQTWDRFRQSLESDYRKLRSTRARPTAPRSRRRSRS